MYYLVSAQMLVDKKASEVRQAPWERDEVKQRGKGANPVVTRNPPLVLADKESLMRTDPTISVHYSIPGAKGAKGEDNRGTKGAAQEAPVQKADSRTKAAAATAVADDRKRSKDNIFFTGESSNRDEKVAKRATDNIFFTGNQEDLKAENVGK
jgi:hypothetical protein